MNKWTLAVSHDRGQMIVKDAYLNIGLPKYMMLESANELNRWCLRCGYGMLYIAVPVPMYEG